MNVRIPRKAGFAALITIFWECFICGYQNEIKWGSISRSKAWWKKSSSCGDGWNARDVPCNLVRRRSLPADSTSLDVLTLSMWLGGIYASKGSSSSLFSSSCSVLSPKSGKDGVASENTHPRSMYVHIPYCRRRCHYCSFTILPIGDLPNSHVKDNKSPDHTAKSQAAFRALDDQYLKAILHEIDYVGKVHFGVGNPLMNKTVTAGHDSKRSKLKTVYFGGGTPSLAPESTIASIVNALNRTFGIERDAELTIEMDPGTFDKEKLRSIVDIGFNRISMGVQSFDDEILENIGRVHTVHDVEEALHLVNEQRKCGYNVDVSIDLISGLPGLSLGKWAETLELAVNRLNPDHLSVYDLQVESGTKFGRVYELEGEERDSVSPKSKFHALANNCKPLPTAEDCAFMYRYASAYLRSKGYEHYEISSYAKDSKRSKHNLNYWDMNSQWYAVGMGATSSVGNVKFLRPQTYSGYVEWVSQLNASISFQDIYMYASEDDGVADDSLHPYKSLDEIVMTRLRTKDGLDLKWVRETYGSNAVSAIIEGMKLGFELNLAELHEDNETLNLVDPDGFLFSNSLISNVFLGLETL